MLDVRGLSFNYVKYCWKCTQLKEHTFQLEAGGQKVNYRAGFWAKAQKTVGFNMMFLEPWETL